MQGILSSRFWLGLAALNLLRKQTTLRREESRLGGAKRGDRAAFDQLVAEHTPALRRFIATRVNARDCEDVLQDTWLAVWQALPTFDRKAKFRTWAIAICYHKVQDHWRQEMSRPPSSPFLDEDTPYSYTPVEFSSIELREALRTVWQACSDSQRELLTLYYSDGLTLQEISRVTGKNLNTVKYQFYRAHDTAAQILPSEGITSQPGTEVIA